MPSGFSNLESPAPGLSQRRRLSQARLLTALALLLSLLALGPAAAQERMLFPAVDNAQAVILEKIRNEQVRLDVAVWYLVDREVSLAIVNKHKSGVPVRVLGDRAALFEADPNTRTEFEYLASHGVPIRLRYEPTWFPEIMHWKCGIFVGQNVVEFGSANWTAFELKPWSPTNFKDETVMLTDDPALVRAFLTKFDQMWVDTTHFLDWHPAYRRETGQNWATPMTISRVRLEPDYPTNIPGMVWSQGAELNNAIVAEIEREAAQIDMVIYRLSDTGITDALVRRRQAGVPVRIFIEPLQYRQPDWPEYWLTGARVDQLWLAGVRIRERVHEGLTHMKTLITSTVALNGSSNFTRNWQRDHNYFISAVSKPSLYLAMKDRFDAMWRDTTHYRDFYPQRPQEPVLAGPGNQANGVSRTPRLEWRRARWAVAFDVYLGTSPQALAHHGRVNAQLIEDPPATYSWTPGQALESNTTYYWQIVSRTFATAVDPSLQARSPIHSFTTGTATTPGSGGTPTGSGCSGSAPGPGWVCVDGGWIPPDAPPPPPPPPPPPAPPPPPDGPGTSPADPTASCSTPSPGPGWTCLNGGWLPPGHPLAACGGMPDPFAAIGGGICINGSWAPPAVQTPGPDQGAPANCSTPSPGAGWICLNGGWLPPGHPALGAWIPPPPQPHAPPPASSGCTTPDPFVAMGGGVCINGGWVPWTHPGAG